MLIVRRADEGMDRLVRWIWLMVFGIMMCRRRHGRKLMIGVSGTNVIIYKIMTENKPNLLTRINW